MLPDADIRVVLLDHAGGGRERSAPLVVPTEPDARALLIDRAVRSEFAAVRQTAVRALASDAAAFDVRTILLDRVAHDENVGVREAAVRGLAGIATAPGVRDTLLGRVLRDISESIWRTALDIVLSLNSADLVAEYIVSNRVNELKSNLARQLLVRFVSCSAGFTPEVLPSIEDGCSWP